MKRKDFISIVICILCAVIVGFGSIGIYKIINEPAQSQVKVVEAGEEENSYPRNVKSPYRNAFSHIDVYYN